MARKSTIEKLKARISVLEKDRQKEEQKKLDQEENKGNWFRKLFRK